jgi:hypothetical protein
VLQRGSCGFRDGSEDLVGRAVDALSTGACATRKSPRTSARIWIDKTILMTGSALVVMAFAGFNTAFAPTAAA